MDSVELNENGDCIEDVSAEHTMSLESPGAYNVFGEPEVLPRVGDNYQVAIPQLISESDYLLYTKIPTDAENGIDAPCDFLLGLSLPIMWIFKEVEDMKTETPEILCDSYVAHNKNGLSRFESVRETQNVSYKGDSKLEVEFIDATLDCEAAVEEATNLALKEKMSKWKGPGYCLVPGSHCDFWSDIENASFLLGLYIFEKNFVQVKRFIELKEMGEILSFYYGKFYRTDEYQKWSACRKMRSRRAVYGQRLFSGPRLQELLSRLLPHVLAESKNDLFQVSKTFGEGKIQLEEYVSSLKSMVGMKILVEAVGIGKGKQDLTSIVNEPSKSNQFVRTRSEIPSGKECSSLMPSEIIKFLTGDYRLSKARSNDLFWEAVWPRLLARGWHSEQPNNKQGYAAGSKHSLVFLVSGIKKFSRRRLVKGKHYYDSVTDVLNKVTSEPGLLELEAEEYEGNKSKEVYEWPNGTKSEQDDLPDRKRPCYLQPRTPNRITDVVKFTIVDTSLADGRSSKVRELRTLPVEISTSHSSDSDTDTSDVSTDESNCAYMLLTDQGENTNTKSRRTISDRRTHSEGEDKDLETSASHQGIHTNDPKYTNVPNFKNRNNLIKDKKKQKAVENLDCLAPVGKRQRRLSACSLAETSHRTDILSVESGCEQYMRDCGSSAPVLAENVLSQIVSSQDKLSSTSSSRGSPVESIEGTLNCDDRHGSESIYKQPQIRTMIDLNLPQVPPDLETDVFMTDFDKGPYTHPSKEPDNVNPLKSSAGVSDSDQRPNLNLNSRRQSTRNRPPTARALEALANGFLTIRKKRSKETTARENSKSRPSQRARIGPRVDEFSTGGSSLLSEVGNGVLNCEQSNMFDDYQFLSLGIGNRTHES